MGGAQDYFYGALACFSLIRVIIAYLPLGTYLYNDHLLSSPLTSQPRLQEGLFLYNHDINPYSGGMFRHSPLLLTVFSTILPLNAWSTPLIWTACDVLAGWCLTRIFAHRKIPANYQSAWLIAAIYLFNPYLVLPSLAQSTSSIDNAIIIISIYTASRGRRSITLLLLAIATHLSLIPALLFLPISLILLHGSRSALQAPVKTTGWSRIVPLAIEFVIYMMALTGISSLTAGGWSWIEPTWGAILLLPDLTPNVGLWWYFFTEMFDQFRPFFLVVFSMNMLIYVAPISIKFQHDPVYATFILVGIMGMFKPYPTLSDSGLFLSMMSIFPETFPYLNNAIVTALLHLHASLLLPLFNRLWLAQGTGNANFFYASTLVFGMANGFAITDSIWAGIRIAFGEAESGWSITQVYDEKRSEPSVRENGDQKAG